MAKLLLSLLFLLPSVQAFAAWSYLAGSSTCAGGLNSATTSAVNMTGATLIILSVAGTGTGTPSDSQSNTWTKLGSQTSGIGVIESYYYSINPSVSSSQTFSITDSETSVCVAGFVSGGTSVLDQSNGSNSGSGSAASLTTGSVTPSANGELIVTGLGWYDNTETANITSDLYIDTGIIPPGAITGGVAGTYYGSAISYLIQPTAAAVNPNWYFNTTSYTVGTVIGTFEGGGSGSLGINPLASVCATSPNGSAITTNSINTTGASLIAVTIFGYGGIGSPSDSKSNSYTALNNYSSGSYEQQIYYVSSPTTSTAQTFTESDGSNYPAICVEAFSGTATSSPFDQQNGASASSGTTLQTGSVTPTVNNELLLTGFEWNNAGLGLSIGSNFSLASTVNPTGGDGPGEGISYFVQSTAGAVNPTWTLSSNAGNPLTTAIATFKKLSTSVAKTTGFNFGF